jgi:asparagine synthase (glutamine-hydrolysing)
MSAISLVWKNADEQPLSTSHRAMLSAMERYGPGRKVSWSDSRIALGSNLSSSLPEDRFDLQPIWDTDRYACMVADVRLDNRADLARELGLTHPEELADSAFLMAAWLRWGAGCLDRLIGGFAFAVWTPSRQEIFAARDHIGERPLFYHRDKNLFALASMPHGLHCLPGMSRNLQEPAIADWIASLPPRSTDAFFEGIVPLPPGHLLRVTPHSLETKQYWSYLQAKPIRFRRDEDYAEALLEIFDQATEARLRSTRPVGSFLSAGLDSSSVTASAARLLGAKGESLRAYTSVPRPGFTGVVAPGYFAFEAEGAADLARMYPNIQHDIVDSRGRDMVCTMKSWVDALNAPVPNLTNLLWLSAIYGRAKDQGIGVMLDGSDGNGTFSYNSWSILSRFFRRGRWLKLARTAQALHRSRALGISSAARIALDGPVVRWIGRRRVPPRTTEALSACLANPSLIERYGLRKKILDSFYPPPCTLVQEHSALFENSDPGPFRAAIEAATQIEGRDPTADKRLVDFCFAIPREQYIAARQPRSLARRAMKDRLPPSILTNTSRGLQSADWFLSMAEALPALRRELALIAESPAAAQALDIPAMQNLLDTWPEAGFESAEIHDRYHFWLTRAFSMGYFLRSHESPLV